MLPERNRIFNKHHFFKCFLLITTDRFEKEIQKIASLKLRVNNYRQISKNNTILSQAKQEIAF